MASELRVNSLTNRSGLGTITYTDSGLIVSGVGTFANGLTVDGTQTTVKSLKLTGDNYNANWFKTTNKLRFNDNAKATFGTSDDLSIWHNGSHSYIKDTGTGRLIIQSSQLCLQDTSGYNHLIANPGADVQLYYDFTNHSTPKLKTTATGVTITGTAVAGALDISGDIDVDGHTNLDNVSVAGTSDFTGTATFSGVSNFNSNVSVSGNLNVAQNIVHTGDTDTKLSFYNDVITLNTAGIERFRIYNDGVVAIGQSSKSSTVGAGNLDIQGNGTSCIIEMGNPFPTFSGGIVPEFRITATNSTHTVDFETVWGGDNLLHKHLSFSGGNTDIWDGTYNNRIARFDGNGRLMLNSTSITNSYDYLTVKRPASNFGELNMTVDANTSTNSAANAFIFTKSKHTYWNGYGFQSSHGHIGAIVGKRDSAGGDSDQEIRIEIGGTHINQSEEKTWNFKNNGDLSISDGNLVVASGRGIDFSATSHTSGKSSELLDDYEEGTWTPTARNDGSFTNAEGRYVKIGQQVTVWGFIPTVTNNTSNNVLQCSGLPFTVTTSGMTEFVGSLMIRFLDAVSSVNGVSFNTYVASGRDFIEFFACRDDGNNYESVLHSDLSFTNSNGIRFCISYIA